MYAFHQTVPAKKPFKRGWKGPVLCLSQGVLVEHYPCQVCRSTVRSCCLTRILSSSHNCPSMTEDLPCNPQINMKLRKGPPFRGPGEFVSQFVGESIQMPFPQTHRKLPFLPHGSYSKQKLVPKPTTIPHPQSALTHNNPLPTIRFHRQESLTRNMRFPTTTPYPQYAFTHNNPLPTIHPYPQKSLTRNIPLPTTIPYPQYTLTHKNPGNPTCRVYR